MHIRSLGSRAGDFFRLRKGRASYKVLSKRVSEGMTIDGIHVCQLIAAMLIASIGLNLDSTEAVIGAMLICPLMGSVIAMAYSVATLDMRSFRNAAIGLGLQVLVCLLTSSFYFIISPLSKTTSELLTNSSATVWDALIALVGGFAGALGISRKQEPYTLLAGVAVATALMPPLCSVGYGIAVRDIPLALSALYEFLINVVFITFGSEMVFVILRVPLKNDLDGDGVVTEEEAMEARKRSRRLRINLVVCSIVFALPCFFFSARMIKTSLEETGSVFQSSDTFDTELTTRELEAICPEFVDYRIGAEENFDLNKEALTERIVATVVTSKDIGKSRQNQLEALIRLNITQLDEVVFEVKPEGGNKNGNLAANVS